MTASRNCSTFAGAECLAGVHTLLHDHFAVQRGESVVLTVDEHSDPALVRSLREGVATAGAQHCVVAIPRLPFQGSLADPFIPEPVYMAVRECDVWLDCTFPYMAGSGAFDSAMERKRARYLLVGDLTADGFGRLYGTAVFDDLFALQAAADKVFTDAQGKEGRITTPAGSDFTFRFGKPATVKHRRAVKPGAQTIPGSAIFYPELGTLKGRIVLESVFHEYYVQPETPICLEMNEQLRIVSGGGVEAHVLERSLRRASRGGFGDVIHLTVGLNPGARATGSSFIEDIRVVGRNAVGLGLPWWLPGGGENHPDAVLCDQSLWIDGEPIIEAGRPAASHPLANLLKQAEQSVATRKAEQFPPRTHP